MEVVWTWSNLNGQGYFDSGKKFCPTSTVQNCNIGSFLKEGKKGIMVSKKNKTTWGECRDLCNNEDDCDYFKWKVQYMKHEYHNIDYPGLCLGHSLSQSVHNFFTKRKGKHPCQLSVWQCRD